MEQAVYQYVERIVVFGIFSSIVLQLLPKGKYEKYVKLYTGFLFLLFVCLPIVKWLKLDQNWNTFYEQSKVDLELDGVEREAKEKLFQKYEETLSRQLATILKERGYDSDVTVITDRQKEGTIQKIQVLLYKNGERKEGEIAIPVVQIGENTKNKTELEKKEEKEVKAMINEICKDEKEIEVEVKRQ